LRKIIRSWLLPQGLPSTGSLLPAEPPFKTCRVEVRDRNGIDIIPVSGDKLPNAALHEGGRQQTRYPL
jgi:hypothetical protein